MDINPLSNVSANMFSHSVGCIFILLMLSFAVQELFSLMCSHLFIFFFCMPCLRNISDKILLWAMSEILLPMISPRSFVVLGLIFKSLMHFEFILMYAVRMWPSYIFLRVTIQFSQYHLLNKLSLAYCTCLLPLSNINWL